MNLYYCLNCINENSDKCCLSNIIKKIFFICQDRFNEYQFDVNELSRTLGLSRQQIHEIVTLNLKITPSDLIRRIRIENAIKLLPSNNSIMSISRKVGINHVKTLRRSLSRIFDIPPNNLKKNLNVNINSSLIIENSLMQIWKIPDF